jgi:hypothetical protein
MGKETTPDRDFAAREATTKRTTLTYRRNTEMIYERELQDNGYVAAKELTYPNLLEETKRKRQMLDTLRWMIFPSVRRGIVGRRAMERRARGMRMGR